MVVVDLGRCVVLHNPDQRWTLTVFENGCTCPAVPHDTDAYREWARKAGCVNVDEYAFQHDLMHVIYGLARYGGPSPALLGVAMQQPVSEEQAQAEEEAVQRLHRLFNLYTVGT